MVWSSHLQQVALVRVPSEEQPVQGGGGARARQVGDALQLRGLAGRRDVQVPPDIVDPVWGRWCPAAARGEPQSSGCSRGGAHDGVCVSQRLVGLLF